MADVKVISCVEVMIKKKLIPMSRSSYISLVCLTGIIMLSCGPQLDKSMILGTWRGADWRVEGQASGYDATSASFTFRDDKSYTYTYANAEETGTYYIVNQELYTTPAGGVKMMVKIRTLTQDSLVFDMNRGGMAETLTLLRE